MGITVTSLSIDYKEFSPIFGMFFYQLEAATLIHCREGASSTSMSARCVGLYEKEDRAFLEESQRVLKRLGEQFDRDHGPLKERSVAQFYQRRGAALKEAECKLKKEYVGGLTSPPFIWDANTGEIAGQCPLWVERVVVPFYRDLKRLTHADSPQKGIEEEEMKGIILHLDNADIIKQNATGKGGGKGRSCLGVFAHRALNLFTTDSRKAQKEHPEEYAQNFELLDKVINVFCAVRMCVGNLEKYNTHMKLSYSVTTFVPKKYGTIYQECLAVKKEQGVKIEVLRKGPLLFDIEESAGTEASAIRKEKPTQDTHAHLEEVSVAIDIFQKSMSDLLRQLNELKVVLERLRSKKIEDLSTYMYNFIPDQVSKLKHFELTINDLGSCEQAFTTFEEGRQVQLEEGMEKGDFVPSFESLLRQYELEKIIELSLEILNQFHRFSHPNFFLVEPKPPPLKPE